MGVLGRPGLSVGQIYRHGATDWVVKRGCKRDQMPLDQPRRSLFHRTSRFLNPSQIQSIPLPAARRSRVPVRASRTLHRVLLVGACMQPPMALRHESGTVEALDHARFMTQRH